MAATLKASTTGLDLVDQARCKKGWAKAEPAWADLAFTSTATLKRFWGGVAIGADTFQAICKVVGLEDWEAIVESEDDSKSPSQISGKRLSFAIAGSIEEIDKHKLNAIVALLNKLGGDTSIEIVDINDGSIRLILGGSEEALNRIEALFQSGELAQIEGMEVEDVHSLEPDEQIALLRKNGGEAQNLMRVNLSSADFSDAILVRADLSDANLSDADLSDANLKFADLSDANLSGANLSGANLRLTILVRADLSDTDLSGANLNSTDLSDADLRLADLSRANLSGANLNRARLRGTRLRGANLRGANLSGTRLSGANLRGANLIGANLSGANLSHGNLSRANLIGANLIGANLRGANLSDTNFSDANFSDADLSDAKVIRANFGFGFGLSDESKADLSARGAIFDDGLERTNEVLVPSK